jgi:hypothetical protein
VTVWLIGSSLRHVTFVPTLTVRSSGMNMSDFSEITVAPSAELSPDGDALLLQPATVRVISTIRARRTRLGRRRRRISFMNTGSLDAHTSVRFDATNLAAWTLDDAATPRAICPGRQVDSVTGQPL